MYTKEELERELNKAQQLELTLPSDTYAKYRVRKLIRILEENIRALEKLETFRRESPEIDLRVRDSRPSRKLRAV